MENTKTQKKCGAYIRPIHSNGEIQLKVPDVISTHESDLEVYQTSDGQISDMVEDEGVIDSKWK